MRAVSDSRGRRAGAAATAPGEDPPADEVPHHLTGRAREIELLLRERRARSRPQRRRGDRAPAPVGVQGRGVRPRPRGLRARPAPPDARAACRRRPTGHRVPRLGGAALRPGRHGRPARPARQRRRGPRRRQRPAADEGALPRQRVGHRAPPEAIETAIETIVDGIAVRGRIDAVFRRPDGGFTVVDWKTGAKPSGEQARVGALQLAAYRLAFARLRGLAPDQVDGAFYYAASGETVWPQLPDEAELVRPAVDTVRLSGRALPLTAQGRAGASRGQRGCCSCDGCWTGIGWVRSSSCSSPGRRRRSRSRHRGAHRPRPPRPAGRVVSRAGRVVRRAGQSPSPPAGGSSAVAGAVRRRNRPAGGRSRWPRPGSRPRRQPPRPRCPGRAGLRRPARAAFRPQPGYVDGRLVVGRGPLRRVGGVVRLPALVDVRGVGRRRLLGLRSGPLLDDDRRHGRHRGSRVPWRARPAARSAGRGRCARPAAAAATRRSRWCPGPAQRWRPAAR